MPTAEPTQRGADGRPGSPGRDSSGAPCRRGAQPPGHGAASTRARPASRAPRGCRPTRARRSQAVEDRSAARRCPTATSRRSDQRRHARAAPDTSGPRRHELRPAATDQDEPGREPSPHPASSDAPDGRSQQPGGQQQPRGGRERHRGHAEGHDARAAEDQRHGDQQRRAHARRGAGERPERRLDGARPHDGEHGERQQQHVRERPATPAPIPARAATRARPSVARAMTRSAPVVMPEERRCDLARLRHTRAPQIATTEPRNATRPDAGAGQARIRVSAGPTSASRRTVCARPPPRAASGRRRRLGLRPAERDEHVQPVDARERLGRVVARGVQAVRQQHDQALVGHRRRQLHRRLAQARGEVGGAVPAQRRPAPTAGPPAAGAPPAPAAPATPAPNVSTDGCSFSRPVSLATITPAAATAASATASPCIDPEMSTTRHTARRCAVQVRVTMSSAPGRRDALGVQASSVRSRSRSPSSPRDGPSRRVPRALAGPTRPSCRNTRPASRRAAARSATSVATAMSASSAAAASGSSATAASNASGVQLAELGRDVVERRVLLARAAGGCGCADARSRPGRGRGWKPGGVLPDGPSAFPSASGASSGIPGRRATAGRAARRSPTRACGPRRRRPGCDPRARRRRRRAPSRGPGPARRATRPGPVSTSARSIAPRTDEPIRTSRCSRVARVSTTERSTHRPESPLTDDVIARSPASSW